MDQESLRDQFYEMLDQNDATRETDEEELLTWLELAELVGVKPKPNGNISGTELFNAVLHIADNQRFQQLPPEEQGVASRSAEAALAAIRLGFFPGDTSATT